MAKLPIKPFLLLIRRSYKAAAESGSVRLQTAAEATAMTTRTAATELGSGKIRVDNVSTIKDEDEQKAEFWMRDPKTGNWIPESHFGEFDVVDLREKLLQNNKRKL